MAVPIHGVVNERTGRVVATAVEEARGPWRSFRGLMFRKSLPAGHGMLFRPAKGIHTQFMRFPIDLIYLDMNDRVVKVRPTMRPWRFDFTNAAAVIEVTGGTVAAVDVRAGDYLRFGPAGG
jgi:uncharacterized protein